jgi:hypothetical protein
MSVRVYFCKLSVHLSSLVRDSLDMQVEACAPADKGSPRLDQYYDHYHIFYRPAFYLSWL